MKADEKTMHNDPNGYVYQERTWKDSSFFAFVKRFSKNKLALTGFIILLFFILVAIFAPVLSPYDPATIDPINANKGLSAEHIFGTDSFGRDILSRVIYGTRYSLAIGLCSSLFGCLIGVIFGAIAGFFGGVVESVILRICDVIQSIPNMLLCIMISQVLGAGFFATIVALSFYSIPELVRLLRATMLSVREQEFVEAERALDISEMRILLSHILPNCLAPIIVSFSISIGMKIMGSAGLSFLGLGIQEPIAEWGAMIAAGRAQLRFAPQIVLFPGICIALIVIAFNVIGDGLRDTLDPKLRK